MNRRARTITQITKARTSARSIVSGGGHVMAVDVIVRAGRGLAVVHASSVTGGEVQDRAAGVRKADVRTSNAGLMVVARIAGPRLASPAKRPRRCHK